MNTVAGTHSFFAFRFSSLAVWQAGFRPFFTLALISGAVYPLVWALLFSGQWTLPRTSLPLLQWHAHEMLFGFGWAVLGGFLLTASKNWVKIRGIHGTWLAILTGFWIAERIAVLYANDLPALARFALMNAFILSCAGYIVYSLIRYRHQDSFKDNYFFLIGLPLFLIAKNLLLDPSHFALGAALSLGLFRLAFAVMLERTTPQFMRNAMKIDLPKRPALDTAVKMSVLASVFSPLMTAPLAAAVLGAAGTLMFIRFLTWKPLAGLKQFGIAIMYAGHAGLILHLWMQALGAAGVPFGIGTLSIHVFTFLCMGIIIPGMLIRISQGHTGRAIAFIGTDRVALALMFAASLARLVLTQFFPQHYSLWIAIAAVGWALCFALLSFRLIPFLFLPRVDGKIH
ncbi:MAG: NnrS family protein [Bacteriovoracia bacterium]